ncbi:MAG: SDR family NAD(P)-dependent oxidoreductase [Candidatus Dormibacteria bacterium]
MDLQLAGRRTLITGASQGIGLEIARTLAEEGGAVAICARGEGPLSAATTSLRALGGQVFAASVDVTAPGELANFVAAAAGSLGGLDAVVANAGGSCGGGLQESTSEQWRDTYELNVGHAAELLRVATPHLAAANSPAAVLISSISGTKPAPRAQYGVSKAGLIYLAAALARELSPLHIRVNAISPGSIFFPGGGWDSLREGDPRRFQSFLDRDLPEGRLGTVEEVARVVAFVLSPLASWINGANIAVDGAQGRPSSAGW